MEIEQLRQLLKVANLGSFTKAAEAVGLSQPALSRSIARLEEEIGQPIFERQTRKIELTDAGKFLLTRAEQIVALVDETKGQICDDGHTGRVRVGAIPTIAPYFLPDLLRSFARVRPKAQVIVREDTTANLLKALSEGVLDLCVLALPIDAKYLDVQELFEEELLLVLPANHPLADKKQIRLSDVESLPFVLLGETHCLTENVLSFCRQKSFNPVSVEQTNQLITVQELVALDHGVSMIPEMARKFDISERRVYRSLSGTRPSRSVAMAWNPYRFQSKLTEKFKLELQRHAGSRK